MHDCNNCGGACYCHGDIDDCPVETIEYAYEHCVGCGCREDEYDGGYYDDEYRDENEEYYASLRAEQEEEWAWIVRAHDEHIAP